MKRLLIIIGVSCLLCTSPTITKSQNLLKQPQAPTESDTPIINPLQKFAVISDYGWGPTSTRNTDTINCRKVANLIKSNQVDFVITCGDNSHGLGELEYLDSRIGAFYKDYINSGNFYAAEGNHDRMTGLGRWFRDYVRQSKSYGTFQKGNISFYRINSEDSSFEDNIKYIGEVDGVKKGSRQYNYIAGQRLLSNTKWNIPFFHHPPYPNLTTPYLDMYSILRCYGDSLNMSITYSGHTHEAARTKINGYNWLSVGNGGAALNNPSLVPRRAGNLFQDFTNYGALFVSDYGDSLLHSFKNVNNQTLYEFALYPQKSVMTKVFIEARINNVDTLKAKIRQGSFPFAVIDSAMTMMNANGNALFYFPKAEFDRDYYLVINHRNSIETWSSNPMRFNNRANITYDFSDDASKAAGDNLTFVNGRWCIYTGDVNQDGIIDSSDLNAIKNAYVRYIPNTDLNGDGATNQADMNIAHNNSKQFILKIMP